MSYAIHQNIKCLTWLATFTLLNTPQNTYAQNQNIDSLFAIWNDLHRSPLERLQAINYIAFHGYRLNDPDSATLFARQELKLARDSGSKLYESAALITLAEVERIKAKYVDAIAYYQKALTIKTAIKEYRGAGAAYYGIGLCYMYMGQSDEAAKQFKKKGGYLSSYKKSTL